MKKTIFIISLFIFQIGFSQTKSKADRFFEKGDYTTAAKYYEIDLQYAQSKKNLIRIAICYYNTFEYEEAGYNLKELVKGNFYDSNKEYNNIYNFKLYQVLSAMGNYEEGIEYLDLYYKNLNRELDREYVINTIEELKLKSPDYEIQKADFNSDASDFGAVKHGERVYFTSDRGTKAKKLFSKKYLWTHKSFLDIYSLKVSPDLHKLTPAISISKEINSELHEGNFCFSTNGNTIYVSKSDDNMKNKSFDKVNKNNIHIYKAIRMNGEWSELHKLPFNTPGDSYQHPALSPDGGKLYFSSNRPGGEGSFDLYYVDVACDSYGEPINLGKTINTPNREHFPFITEEGNLFFSSNGHLGLGMLDVFASQLIDDSYTKPVNLGSPINSRYDDFNLNYYKKNKGFFASNRSAVNDDIYSFTQTGEIFMKPFANVFEVKDKQTKENIPDAIVALYNAKNKMIYSDTLTQSNSFTRELNPGKFSFSAYAKGYMAKEIPILTDNFKQRYVIYLKKKQLKPTSKKIKPRNKNRDPKLEILLNDDKGPSVVERNGKLYFDLQPIYFDFDMWNIRSDSEETLNELAEKLERYPNVYIKISSHTDSRGTTAYNQILSHRRAESTRNYLALEAFINARRMQFEGFGETEPIFPCEESKCTEEEHQFNRRSEFEIIKY